MFDTKIAFIVRDDLPTWQRLNVVAFLATGIAAAAPEIIGERYVDAQGRRYGAISGQPMLIFAADLPGLQNVHRKGLERELTLIPMCTPCSRPGTMKPTARFFALKTRTIWIWSAGAARAEESGG